jgi:hypothetical protein
VTRKSEKASQQSFAVAARLTVAFPGRLPKATTHEGTPCPPSPYYSSTPRCRLSPLRNRTTRPEKEPQYTAALPRISIQSSRRVCPSISQHSRARGELRVSKPCFPFQFLLLSHSSEFSRCGMMRDLKGGTRGVVSCIILALCILPVAFVLKKIRDDACSEHFQPIRDLPSLYAKHSLLRVSLSFVKQYVPVKCRLDRMDSLFSFVVPGDPYQSASGWLCSDVACGT